MSLWKKLVFANVVLGAAWVSTLFLLSGDTRFWRLLTIACLFMLVVNSDLILAERRGKKPATAMVLVVLFVLWIVELVLGRVFG